MTFEHRHENKSCSACPKDQVFKFSGFQVSRVPNNIHGSQLLSDIQTFFMAAYKKECRKMLPWAWMALEYLKQGEFVLKSDVWSFGVVLWEIYSLGGKPYGLEKFPDVKKKLFCGWRMPAPEYMELLGPGNNFYNQVMLPCWDAVIDKRPTFKTLVQQLQEQSYYLHNV